MLKFIKELAFKVVIKEVYNLILNKDLKVEVDPHQDLKLQGREKVLKMELENPQEEIKLNNPQFLYLL